MTSIDNCAPLSAGLSLLDDSMVPFQRSYGRVPFHGIHNLHWVSADEFLIDIATSYFSVSVS